MRTVYIYIILFIGWCALSAWWYIFYVKGLTTEPIRFDPHENTVAIVEILTMLLVALLFGLALGWQLRKPSAEKETERARGMELKLDEAHHSIENLKEVNKETQGNLAKRSEDFESKRIKLDAQINSLRDEISRLERKETKYESTEEIAVAQAKIQQLEAALSFQKYRENQLTGDVKELKELNKKLKIELLDVSKRAEDKEPVFADFISGQHLGIAHDKVPPEDDLKAIKGIGPVIEKRLKNIGITSYKQIAELDEQTLKQMSEALKFFPDRILRDNWIGQARSLAEV